MHLFASAFFILLKGAIDLCWRSANLQSKSMRKLIEPLRLIPVLKITLGFSLGIVLLDNIPSCWVIIMTLGVLSSIFLVRGFRSKRYSQRWVFGVGALLFSLAMGGIYLEIFKSKQVEIKKPLNTFITLQVDENPVVTKYGSRWSAVFIDMPEGEQRAAGEKCIVYLRDTVAVAYGDLVRVFGRIMPIDAPKNPFEFNFKDYYARQGVMASVFVSKGALLSLGKGDTFFLIRWAKTIQKYTLDVFKDNGFKNDELGVLLALMIGDKQFLDGALKSSYSNIGAMHILAVSGMHVALIYGVLMLLLFFLRGSRLKIFKSILILFVLWLYAFVAGFSPSIVRATVMFTFILAGRIVDRNYNVYNMIAASFLTLLLVNPFYIYDVGFLLSYAAVFSILLFYPFFAAYKPRNIMLGWLFDMIAVSIAAQILTLPFTLYYFHQFPLVFFATNILLIPLTSLIIYGGLILLTFSWWQPFAHLIFIALNELLKLTNSTTRFLESLPYSTMMGIQMDKWQMILLLVSFLILYVFILHRKAVLLLIFLGAILAVMLGGTFQQFQDVKPKIAVYSMRKGTAILFGARGNVYCICDSVQERHSYKFMEPSLMRWRLGSLSEVAFYERSDVIRNETFYLNKGWCSFNGKVVFIPNGKHQKVPQEGRKASVDLLVITYRCKWKPQFLMELISPELVVLDGSISAYQRKLWEAFCSHKNIRLYDVSTSGALVF